MGMKLSMDYVGELFLRSVPAVTQAKNAEGKTVEVKDYYLMKVPVNLKNITDTHILLTEDLTGGARHILPADLYNDDNWILYKDLDKEYAESISNMDEVGICEDIPEE